MIYNLLLQTARVNYIMKSVQQSKIVFYLLMGLNVQLKSNRKVQ